MYRKILLFVVTVLLLNGLFSQTTHAQMMGNGNSMMQGLTGTPEVTPSQQDLQDIQVGQILYAKFQNRQVPCVSLQDADFEKIGEYLMNQQAGSSIKHAQMNQMMQQMMGNQGEEQMHITIGKSATGCTTNNQQGGGRRMMGWYGTTGMMGSGFGYGFGILWLIGYLVVLIDLVLGGMWLWKQLKKK